MSVNNWPKLIIVLAVCVSVVFLMAIGRLETSDGMPILTLFAGYGVGNGIAASRDQPVEPVIGRRRTNRPRSNPNG